jgi:hypothetical protein
LVNSQLAFIGCVLNIFQTSIEWQVHNAHPYLVDFSVVLVSLLSQKKEDELFTALAHAIENISQAVAVHPQRPNERTIQGQP